MMKILGLITARKNSKGIPRKNLSELGGQPLIAWTIQAALESSVLDAVIVSTDCEEIASIGKKYGASIPFMRPKELANDNAPGIAPVVHACQELPDFDVVVLLQPTSPLRNSEHIADAVTLFKNSGAESCVSVTHPKHHPNWLYTTKQGFLDRYEKTDLIPRRQDLPEYFALNGAIYIAYSEFVLTHHSFLGDKTIPFVMRPEDSLDIDRPVDLAICETILKIR